MIELKIAHHMPTETNPVYIKEYEVAAGHYVRTHVHNYDHYGLLGQGVVIVDLNGKKTSHSGPCVIEIKAGKAHKITAVTDVTWFCIHSSKETDETTIDETLITREAHHAI